MVSSRLFICFVGVTLLTGCLPKFEPGLSGSLSNGSTGRSLAQNRLAVAGPKRGAPSIEVGKSHFRSGHYGLAEVAFRKYIEKQPQNPEAWLGLAATYDHLKKFDLATRAYDTVILLVGHTPTVLNNLGYHYYLQGNLDNSHKTFREANEKYPEHLQIQNNLLMVESEMQILKEG